MMHVKNTNQVSTTKGYFYPINVVLDKLEFFPVSCLVVVGVNSNFKFLFIYCSLYLQLKNI